MDSRRRRSSGATPSSSAGCPRASRPARCRSRSPSTSKRSRSGRSRSKGEQTMAEDPKDPREDRHPETGAPGKYPTPEGKPKDAPGGLGTGTEDDPSKKESSKQ